MPTFARPHAHFTFRIRQGSHSSDVPVDLLDDKAAWDEAAGACSDMIRDTVARLGDSPEWRLEVADRSGTIRHLFRLTAETFDREVAPVGDIDKCQCALRFDDYHRHDICRAANLRAVVTVYVSGSECPPDPASVWRPFSFLLHRAPSDGRASPTTIPPLRFFGARAQAAREGMASSER